MESKEIEIKLNLEEIYKIPNDQDLGRYVRSKINQKLEEYEREIERSQREIR